MQQDTNENDKNNNNKAQKNRHNEVNISTR